MSVNAVDPNEISAAHSLSNGYLYANRVFRHKDTCQVFLWSFWNDEYAYLSLIAALEEMSKLNHVTLWAL